MKTKPREVNNGKFEKGKTCSRILGKQSSSGSFLGFPNPSTPKRTTQRLKDSKIKTPWETSTKTKVAKKKKKAKKTLGGKVSPPSPKCEQVATVPKPAWYQQLERKHRKHQGI